MKTEARSCRNLYIQSIGLCIEKALSRTTLTVPFVIWCKVSLYLNSLMLHVLSCYNKQPCYAASLDQGSKWTLLSKKTHLCSAERDFSRRRTLISFIWHNVCVPFFLVCAANPLWPIPTGHCKGDRGALEFLVPLATACVCVCWGSFSDQCLLVSGATAACLWDSVLLTSLALPSLPLRVAYFTRMNLAQIVFSPLWVYLLAGGSFYLPLSDQTRALPTEGL